MLAFVRSALPGSAFLAALLLLTAPAGAQVTVEVNGSAVDFASAPIVQDGRVFVPLRGVFERLGASVDYSNGTINASGNGRTITLQIGSTQATINNQSEIIDVAPFIIGSSTYVPLRFVSQALGANVDYDNSNRVVSIRLSGAPSDVSYVAPANDDDVDIAPPPIPVYEQPELASPNEIWQPGYWAYGDYGYYWVPGTWVEPPQPNYLWTPGYWRWNNDRYAFTNGYWATAVGFYGGVNYGAGYYGNGYVGGRWENNTFRYNTYVSHVNTTVVQNVYVDRTVIVVNTTAPRTAYNGGPHGIVARPQPEQLTVARAPHINMTPAQNEHLVVAGQDRRLLATVNHNAPPVMAVAHPLTAANPAPEAVPVTSADRVAPHAAPVRVAPAAPVRVAPAAPVRVAPVAPVRVAPVAPVRVAPAAPVRVAPAAPVRVAPAAPVRVAPAAPVRVAPAAPVRVAPVAPVRVAPVAPVRVAPVAPVRVAPAAPVRVAPAAPVRVAPAAPVRVAPAAPVRVAPAAPVRVAPAAPVRVAPAAPVRVAPVAPVRVAPAAPVRVAPAAPVRVAPAAPVRVAPAAPVRVAPAAPVRVAPAAPAHAAPPQAVHPPRAGEPHPEIKPTP
jgi:hypothetical protein